MFRDVLGQSSFNCQNGFAGTSCYVQRCDRFSVVVHFLAVTNFKRMSNDKTSGTAVIVGAGPAGLTAAFELATRSEIIPIVLEASDAIGGISRTVQYKGNRIDIGGHRFFSKSDRVMNWWADLLPIQGTKSDATEIGYQNKSRRIETERSGPDPRTVDRVMLIRQRQSRILYRGCLFDYPLSLNARSIRQLGFRSLARIGTSYARSYLFPIHNEQSLEDFFINRFGRELYSTFFKSYTEKVWGRDCSEIDAGWGRQRIKSLDIRKAVQNAVAERWRAVFPKQNIDLEQKDKETSLIERFLYPKFGPGQMWETCAEAIVKHGGTIKKRFVVEKILRRNSRCTGVVAKDLSDGSTREFSADHVISTMPISKLVDAMDGVPESVRSVGLNLPYRDFITVGVLLKRLGTTRRGDAINHDNWIYVQEPELQVGRLQFFNHWSPWLVADPKTTWIGMEYFCNTEDDLWSLSDSEMSTLAVGELESIGFANPGDLLDTVVIRVPKAYPAYFGTYDQFAEIREWVDSIENLHLIGRNGMHRYNNQDHSMLTAMAAVENIFSGRQNKSNVWDVNTEQEYHEDGK